MRHLIPADRVILDENGDPVTNRNNVNFTGGKGGKAGFTCGRGEFYSFGVAKNGGSHGTAERRIETLPIASIVGESKAGNAGGNTALQEAFCFHIIECRSRSAG